MHSGEISPRLGGMQDPYDAVIGRLKADDRSNNDLEKECGVPAETLRDIRSGHIKSPRLDTLRKIAALYQGEARAA